MLEVLTTLGERASPHALVADLRLLLSLMEGAAVKLSSLRSVHAARSVLGTDAAHPDAACVAGGGLFRCAVHRKKLTRFAKSTNRKALLDERL